MTQSVQSTHRYSPMAIVLAIVGAALAVALGLGIAALTLDTTTTVEVPLPEVVPEGPGAGVGGGNNDAYINPDRELRDTAGVPKESVAERSPDNHEGSPLRARDPASRRRPDTSQMTPSARSAAALVHRMSIGPGRPPATSVGFCSPPPGSRG